jgi:hypothetical protein
MVVCDPQQKVVLHKAIQIYMLNAMDGSCGWHPIEQGWKAHCAGITDGGFSGDQYNLFKKHVED